MIIDPKIEMTAKALIQLDAASAQGRIALGFETGRVEISDAANQVATRKLIVPGGSTVDFNFANFAQDGGAGEVDAEGNAVDLAVILALGIRGDANFEPFAPGVNAWESAPLPMAASGTPMTHVSAVGSFPLSPTSHSVGFANPSQEPATLEIIAMGLKV